jgi:lipid II:glycine glycyltransferase (peptidoglycan interpeptide bridge formation enzyme)
VVVDLGPTAEVMRRRLSQKWRNQLNGSEKNGLVLQVSDGHEAYREFVGLYQVMWERKRFETSVDVEEFDRIQELLSGAARMQTFLAKKDGQSIAALVCSLMGETGIYLLGATNEKARELKAAYFLQWQAMLWLKDRGARWYDLGGIDPAANPGGYHFKSGLGGDEATQFPPHAVSGGPLGGVVLRGIAWWRRRRTSSHAPLEATR